LFFQPAGWRNLPLQIVFEVSSSFCASAISLVVRG
jgi:hypothetical protein